jgi:hypothetical protein
MARIRGYIHRPASGWVRKTAERAQNR